MRPGQHDRRGERQPADHGRDKGRDQFDEPGAVAHLPKLTDPRSFTDHLRRKSATFSHRSIVGDTGPVVFHCASGKDRTGFIVAPVPTALDDSEAPKLADFAPPRGRRRGSPRIGERRCSVIPAAVLRAPPHR
ncbi:tyrosine-protein phosphatase [Nocardia sp. NPDC050710]|uniref:tyrosine-protein phosphatase n=1 Tax=Nocardia sp. NPDC050710 TaxID=3157220 RepID=UPI0033C17081